MTKILYVYGEDYAALSFDNLVENGTLTAKGLWDSGTGRYDDGDENAFEHKTLEFGEVDPKFIDWVQSEQDYDESKSNRFYVVED